MNAPGLENGVYIKGTRFAIDRYVSDEIINGKKTGRTFIHWRLLDVIEQANGYRYEVVCSSVNPYPIGEALIIYHIQRDCHLEGFLGLFDTVADIGLKCKNAIDQIEQKAIESSVNNG